MRSTLLFTALLFSVLDLTAAAPISQPHQKRALTLQTYDSMSISNGTGGNAEAEAEAVWTAGVDLSNLVDISASDLAVLKVYPLSFLPSPLFQTWILIEMLWKLQVERENAEDAETQGFDPAISAASGATADALQVGKIKNKVLKLFGEQQVTQIEIAQKQASGEDTSSEESSLKDTQTKLANNIALDKANAGKTSQAISFVGETSVKD